MCVYIWGKYTSKNLWLCVCENDESTSSQQQSEEQDVCLRIIDFCQSSSAFVCLSVCRRVRSKIANLLLILFVLPTFVHVHIMCSCHSLCKSICMHVCKFGFLFFSLLAKVSLTVTVAYFHHCFVSVLYPGGGGVCRFSSFFSCSIESVSIRECVLIVLELHV